MNGQQLIDNFEEQVDDLTELSTTRELALLNRVYNRVCNNRPWSFLKKEWSTTTNGTASIALPTDWAYFLENNKYTENNEGVYNNASPKGVFVNNTFYQLINWDDREQYLNSSGFCYVDVANGLLVFTIAPASGLTLKASYIKIPSDITLATSPIFPERFQQILPYGMATQDFVIQQSDKAQSYAKENDAFYQEYLSDMAIWDSQLNCN